MRTRTLLVSAAIIVATASLGLGAALPAPAADGVTPAFITVDGGTLSITVPSATANLGTRANTVDSGTISDALGQVQVLDARSAIAGSGWVATVTSSAFTPPSGPAIAASAVGYTAGAITKVGTATYTADDPPNLTGVVAAVTATGITGDNSATWNPTINVEVPGGMAAGVYSATITHSVASSQWPAGTPATVAVVGVLGILALMLALAAPAGAATSTTSPLSPRAAAKDTGSIGIRLVDAPVAARDDPRARVYIVDHLNPGTTIKRRIEVSNTTGSTTQIVLYAAGASISKGSFLGAAAQTPNDLSTWTSVSPGKPDLPAGGKATATVTIAVPKDAAPGEQYGVVWAEARSAPETGGGVVQVSRVGVRLSVSVGPGGAPAASFTIDSLTAQRSAEGQPMVVANVHNTGGRALDMNGTLKLSAGPGGLSAGPFPASLGVTLPIGDTEPVSIALDKTLPAGPWDAQITLRSGLVARRGQRSPSRRRGLPPPWRRAPACPPGSTPSAPGSSPSCLCWQRCSWSCDGVAGTCRTRPYRHWPAMRVSPGNKPQHRAQRTYG